MNDTQSKSKHRMWKNGEKADREAYLLTEQWDSERRLRSTAYEKRIGKEQPVRSPNFKVGDVVYDDIHGVNTTVVAVTWQTCGRHWIVSVPGHSAPDDRWFSALKEKKTRVYRKTPNGSWAFVRDE